MIIIKNISKPCDCYSCPGYDHRHLTCKYNPDIDFEEESLSSILAKCPIEEINPQQLQFHSWIPNDPSHDTYSCSGCAYPSIRRTKYCSNCGAFMINKEVK